MKKYSIEYCEWQYSVGLLSSDQRWLVSRSQIHPSEDKQEYSCVQEGINYTQQKDSILIVKSFKHINELHIELGYPLEAITWATGKAVHFTLTGTYKIC